MFKDTHNKDTQSKETAMYCYATYFGLKVLFFCPISATWLLEPCGIAFRVDIYWERPYIILLGKTEQHVYSALLRAYRHR